MQTFLPSDDFALCAMTLDRQRLGKQRVETLQIMQTIAGLSRGKGWINHPATKMWIGHESYLMLYQILYLDGKEQFILNMLVFTRI